MNPVHRRIAQVAILFLASTAAIAQDVDRPGLRERLRERIEQRREPAPADMAAGTTEYSLRHGGLTRKYLLHVPCPPGAGWGAAPRHCLSRWRWSRRVHGRRCPLWLGE
jgi:hypothetical protein